MDSNTSQARSYAAFRGQSRVAAGTLKEVAIAIRRQLDQGDESLVLLFDQEDGRQLDVDLNGSVADVERRFAAESPQPAAAPRGRGRPKLGVIGREVTLLPRHWDWLQSQRGGPSATLRRLVDEARTANRGRDRVRQSQDAINRFISAVAGDLPGFEEANRALYRGERQRFEQEIAHWPADVRTQIATWVAEAFDG